MARLRMRIELSKGGSGVPLNKLASVVEQTQKFFQLLAEDVHIEKDKGEWRGYDFDNESLTFSVEYSGPVTDEQVRAFYAAFDGTTSLHCGTIAQFVRIADTIDTDEVISFGLYQSEEGSEPSEWRCLSRGDALRIANEIQLLREASPEHDQETHLSAVKDSRVGALRFPDSRDRGFEPDKWVAARPDSGRKRIHFRRFMNRRFLAVAGALGVAMVSFGSLLWRSPSGVPASQLPSTAVTNPAPPRPAANPSPAVERIELEGSAKRTPAEALITTTPGAAKGRGGSVPSSRLRTAVRRPVQPALFGFASERQAARTSVSPLPTVVTTDDLRSVVTGMHEEELLKLGPPASRITMFEDGHLVEIYRYSNRNTLIGAVRLTDGAVSSVQLQ